MRAEAADEDPYSGWNREYPKIQILTIAELLAGMRGECPPTQQLNVTFKRAPLAKANAAKQLTMQLGPTVAKPASRPPRRKKTGVGRGD